MSCVRCGDTIITDVPAPFCSHCWDDFGEFLEDDPIETESRVVMADGGREEDVWDPQLPEQTNEPGYRFVRIGERINSLLLLGLAGLYLANSVVSWDGLPGLATAFPYVASFGVIVLAVGAGVDVGVLAGDPSQIEEGDR